MSSLRNIKVIVDVARTIQNYLTIVSSDRNLFNDYIVGDSRHSIIARQRGTRQIQITSYMQIDVGFARGSGKLLSILRIPVIEWIESFDIGS